MRKIFVSVVIAALACVSFCDDQSNVSTLLRKSYTWEKVIRVSKAETYRDILPVEGQEWQELDHVPWAVWYTNDVVSIQHSGPPGAVVTTVVTNSVPGWYVPVTTTNWWVDVRFVQTLNGYPNWHRSVRIPTDSAQLYSTNFVSSTNLIVRSEFVSMNPDLEKFVSWEGEFTPGSAVHIRYVKSPTYVGTVDIRFGVPQSVQVQSLPYTDILEKLPDDYPDTYIRVPVGFDGYILLRFDERTNQIEIRRLMPERLPYERKNNDTYLLSDRDFTTC